ncbi:SDR family NAD(P)-dependent oxidoreductase [Phenylobacterium sp. LjRoot219]|uniref:SDR family NAD(P)-dependent oxidoreductase n=1 Tax=Phenylobacterium sp. LjRoot219 TaxID=3342283 RepID=UPI003ECF803E
MHEELSRDFSLEGRIAVVTGAASGIGRETARVLAQAGARVVVADLDAQGLAETVALVVGGQAQARVTDMADRAAVDALADAVVAEFGRLDVWINAAGILKNTPILEVAEPDLDRLLAVNLKGVFFGCAAAGRVMRERGGSIINVSSAGADTTPPGVSVYAMTKAAVNSLTRSAAKEFGPFQVRVNAVAPGWIDTPMVTYRFRTAAGEIDAAAREAVVRQCAQASPMGRTGTPRDIALAMLYLASDASRFVTGQVLRPNGGAVMP